MLFRSYRMMAHQSIPIDFESLIQSPEASIKAILSYLDLEYEAGMLDHFKDEMLEGKMGDPGRFQSWQINSEPLEKWKNCFNTSFRKFYAGHYLNCLGTDTLRGLGYELDDLKKQLNDIDVTGFGSIMDPAYLCLTMLFRILDPKIFTHKFRQKHQTGAPFLFHG